MSERIETQWIPKYLVVKSSTALLSGGVFERQEKEVLERPVYRRSDGKTLRFNGNRGFWEFTGFNPCFLDSQEHLPAENAEWRFWQTWKGSHEEERDRDPVWQRHRVVIQRGKWAVGENVRVMDQVKGIRIRGEVTKVDQQNVTVHSSYFGRTITVNEDACEICSSTPQFVPDDASLTEMNTILKSALPNYFSTSLIAEIASFTCFGCRSIHGMHIYTGLDAEFYETQKKASVVDAVSISVALRNNTPSTVRQLWVDYGGVEREYSPILSGTTGYMNTFKGHPWHLRIGDDLIGCYILQDVDGDLEIEINQASSVDDASFDIRLKEADSSLHHFLRSEFN